MAKKAAVKKKVVGKPAVSKPVVKKAIAINRAQLFNHMAISSMLSVTPRNSFVLMKKHKNKNLTIGEWKAVFEAEGIPVPKIAD